MTSLPALSNGKGRICNGVRSLASDPNAEIGNMNTESRLKCSLKCLELFGCAQVASSAPFSLSLSLSLCLSLFFSFFFFFFFLSRRYLFPFSRIQAKKSHTAQIHVRRNPMSSDVFISSHFRILTNFVAEPS